MSDLWLRAASVVVGDGTPPLLDHAVRIDHGRISEVVPGSTAPAAAVDLGDRTLVPGFVDAHVHLLFDYQADHETTRARVVGADRDRLTAVAIANAADCLRAGVTTVRDLGDRDLIVRSLRDAVADGIVPGPRILTAGAPVTITAGHLGWLGGTADSDDDLVRVTRQRVAQGVDVVKVMASGGNMTRESNKHEPQFTVQELSLVVREAHRGRKPVAAHALNSEAVRRSIAAGVDTVEHCGWVDRQGRPDLTDQDVQAMRAAGSTAVITMAGIARQLLNGAPDADPEAAAVARQMSVTGGDLHADHEWARRLRAAGVPVVLASDAGVRFTPFAGFLESLRCGIVALDVDAATAVGLATGAAAAALGLDEVGTLTPGKRADLVVLDAVLAAGSRQLGTVRQVRRDGVVVAEDGKVVW